MNMTGLTGAGGGGMGWYAEGEVKYGKHYGNVNTNSKESGTTTYKRGDYDTTALLRDLTNQTQGFDLDLILDKSSKRAREDVQSAVQSIFQNYKETALPEIISGESAGGRYGGTTAQLLANDAFSRAVMGAGELELGVANAYVNQQLQRQQMLQDQFSQVLQANLEQSGEESFDRETKVDERRNLKQLDQKFTLGFSDRRIKENIIPHSVINGWQHYTFNYIGVPIKYLGVMAQEVQERRPDAVVELAFGPARVLTVDYAKIGATFRQLG